MIHSAITNRGAGFARAWVFSLWVLYLASNMPDKLAVFPRDQFQPPGVLRILPDGFYDILLTSAGLQTFKWVLLAGLIACALGVRPWRAVAIPTVLLLTLHQGLPRGFFAYSNHKELSALYVTYVFAMFPATGFSPFRSTLTKARTAADEATTRLTMVLSTSVLLLPYSLIAMRRLSRNDWAFWSSDLLPFYLARNSFSESWYGFGAVGQTVLRTPWLLRALELGFPLVTVFEFLAPLCLLHRRFRHVWLVVMAGFHFTTLLLMDIFFWESLLLFPVLLLDGDVMMRWFDRLRNRFSHAEPDQALVGSGSAQLVGATGAEGMAG